MGCFIPLRWVMFLVLFNIIYDIEGLPVPEFIPNPPRYRKLPEYNCPELYAVNETEAERIKTELKAYKGNYDLVVLNFTVNLDCIFDDEFKFIRHFLVTPKGKTILKYAVEAEYFRLSVFGFKSTILNVNLTQVHVNDSANIDKVFTIRNLTEVSKLVLSKSGYTDVCLSFRNEYIWDILTFLFIPKDATFNPNGIRCQQADGKQDELETSSLVFVVYIVCFFATMHVNLLYAFIVEEIKERRDDGKIYHKDETPFSFLRIIPFLCNLSKRENYRKVLEPSGRSTETASVDVTHCGAFAYIVVSLLIATIYKLLQQLSWIKNIIFLNDDAVLDYLKDTYDSPVTSGYVVIVVISGILYFVSLPVYLGYAFMFTKSLDNTDIAFTLFTPGTVFTHVLEHPSYYRIDSRMKSRTIASNFVKSYKQLFSLAFWAEIARVSVLIPRSVLLKKVPKDSQKQSGFPCFPLCLCILFIILLGFAEQCVYILFGIVNLCLNIIFVLIQTICPILKYFLTGYAQYVSRECKNVENVFLRYAYAFGMLLLYLLFWCGANLYVFNNVMLLISYLLYLTFVAVPFNPSYGVPFIVIVLSLLSYLHMFYEDFQADYMHLLHVVFEILEEHFVKKIPTTEVSTDDSFNLKTSIKVRQIDAEIFEQLSKKYIPYSRKCAFLFIKLAFAITFIVIAFNALGEFGTGIETLKLSDFFSVILLVMIPGIIRNFTAPRENLRKSQLYFKVFKYLKHLDKNNKLEAMVKLDIDDNSSESDDEDDNDVINPNQENQNTVQS